MNGPTARAAAALLALVLTAACGETTAELPPDIMGRWQTEDPEYADRFLEIGPGIIRVDKGEATPPPHTIVTVERGESPSGALYGIEYELASGETEWVRLMFDSRNVTLQLQNRRGAVWRRVSGR